jgi:membrane protease YdiL (CAAX protease family)
MRASGWVDSFRTSNIRGRLTGRALASYCLGVTPRLSPHLRGHLLWFDARPVPSLSAAVGLRLVALAIVLETLRVLAIDHLPAAVPRLALPAPLLILALFLLAWLDREQSPLSRFGPRRWSEWSLVERSYLVQVTLIASVVFIALLGSGLRARAAATGGIGLAAIFLAYLCYGFYQEVVYRGMLQTALVGRWGAIVGVVVANVLFTFGPLHWRNFEARPAVALPMFAGIFAIGLLFGIVYRRSGNLWLVATMHAIGNAFIVTSSA